jgi:hypothetical protein
VAKIFQTRSEGEGGAQDVSGGKMNQGGKDRLAAIVSFVAWFLPFQFGLGPPNTPILA